MMVLTGDCETNEPRSVLLAREEADDDDDDDDDMDRRNEVRRLCGEKRAVMEWKREDCMMPVPKVGVRCEACGARCVCGECVQLMNKTWCGDFRVGGTSLLVFQDVQAERRWEFKAQPEMDEAKVCVCVCVCVCFSDSPSREGNEGTRESEGLVVFVLIKTTGRSVAGTDQKAEVGQHTVLKPESLSWMNKQEAGISAGGG